MLLCLKSGIIPVPRYSEQATFRTNGPCCLRCPTHLREEDDVSRKLRGELCRLLVPPVRAPMGAECELRRVTGESPTARSPAGTKNPLTGLWDTAVAPPHTHGCRQGLGATKCRLSGFLPRPQVPQRDRCKTVQWGEQAPLVAVRVAGKQAVGWGGPHRV